MPTVIASWSIARCHLIATIRVENSRHNMCAGTQVYWLSESLSYRRCIVIRKCARVVEPSFDVRRIRCQANRSARFAGYGGQGVAKNIQSDGVQSSCGSSILCLDSPLSDMVS